MVGVWSAEWWAWNEESCCSLTVNYYSERFSYIEVPLPSTVSLWAWICVIVGHIEGLAGLKDDEDDGDDSDDDDDGDDSEDDDDGDDSDDDDGCYSNLILC